MLLEDLGFEEESMRPLLAIIIGFLGRDELGINLSGNNIAQCSTILHRWFFSRYDPPSPPRPTRCDSRAPIAKFDLWD